MSKVVLDEPEGYRGRRRRFLFPFARKAGGAALPALLIAASIVVVLTVVGVSQLLPKQASGQSISPGAATPPTDVIPTTPSPTNQATFSPMALEGESHNGGAAKPGVCSGCSGGYKIRFIGRNTGWVIFAGINVSQAMNLQITVVYVCGACTRTYYVSVNGGTPVTITPPATADWNTTNSVFLMLAMPAGSDTIKFYNPNSTSGAPDLDRILIKSA